MDSTYAVGDTIEYLVGAELRRVRVTLRSSNIKNGRPGFDGEDERGGLVWGYDSQIVNVCRVETVIHGRAVENVGTRAFVVAGMMRIRETPASGPGAIAGYAASCPVCGMELRSSLRSILELDVLEHGRWHDREGGAR